jgi:hypothetical protein
MPTARFGKSYAATMDYWGAEDCDLHSEEPNDNSGAAQYLIAGDYEATPSECYYPLLGFDLKSFFADNPDAVVTGARLILVCIEREP